jgi:hypothetical protein
VTRQPGSVSWPLSWCLMIWLASSILSSTVWGYTDAECVRCHETKSRQSMLHINMELYKSSVHGSRIGCPDCHQSVTGDEHATTKGSGRVNCENCHGQQNRHAKNGSITCPACHTRHSIFSAGDPRSSVYWGNLGKTCSPCHPVQTGNTGKLTLLTSFRIGSHGKQNFSEAVDKRMCVGCHQGRAAHGEEGPINHQTCYRCHTPHNGRETLLGYIHTNASWKNQPVSAFAAYISLVAIPGMILLLLGVFTGVLPGGRKKT